jgi:hypothetical protein
VYDRCFFPCLFDTLMFVLRLCSRPCLPLCSLNICICNPKNTINVFKIHPKIDHKSMQRSCQEKQRSTIGKWEQNGPQKETRIRRMHPKGHQKTRQNRKIHDAETKVGKVSENDTKMTPKRCPNLVCGFHFDLPRVTISLAIRVFHYVLQGIRNCYSLYTSWILYTCGFHLELLTLFLQCFSVDWIRALILLSDHVLLLVSSAGIILS